MLLAETQRRRALINFISASLRLRDRMSAVLRLALFLSSTTACAADSTVDAMLNGSPSPSGVAVRPGGTADRYEVFIADSGAGRVVRWSNRSRKQVVDVVTGFKTQAAADPQHQTGPRALWFLDPGLLVVGTTRDRDGDLCEPMNCPTVSKRADGRRDRANRTRRAALSTARPVTAITRSRANEFVPDLLFLAIRDADGRDAADEGPRSGRHHRRAAAVWAEGRTRTAGARAR